MYEKHVDREGYTHLDICLECDVLMREDMVHAASDVIENHIVQLIDFDQRVDERGFEFWHVKGV